MLESAVDGIGSRGIVVQGPFQFPLSSQTKRFGKCHHGGLPSRSTSLDFALRGICWVVPRVVQFESAVL